MVRAQLVEYGQVLKTDIHSQVPTPKIDRVRA